MLLVGYFLLALITSQTSQRALALPPSGEAKVLTFPRHRIARTSPSPEADLAAVPLCQKLLTSEAMMENISEQFGEILEASFQAQDRSLYRNHIEQLLVQLEVIEPSHPLWLEIWMSALALEMRAGRITATTGFSARQILRSELQVLRGITVFPDDDLLRELIRDTADDFLRWSDTPGTTSRFSAAWRRDWLQAEIQTLDFLRYSPDDRSLVLSWIKAGLSTVEFSRNYRHVHALAKESPSKSTRARARLWLKQVGILLAQVVED